MLTKPVQRTNIKPANQAALAAWRERVWPTPPLVIGDKNYARETLRGWLMARDRRHEFVIPPDLPPTAGGDPVTRRPAASRC